MRLFCPVQSPRTNMNPWLLLAATTVVAILSQFLYAHLGFSPTDEGFTLAMSRRLLEGQVPHHDFVSLRPVLSPLLHVPELWLGERLFWWSRFVARLEFAVISASWVWVLVRLFRLQWKAWVQAVVAAFVFLYSTYYYPLMAWHTIDGLFFITLGLPLVLGRRTGWPLLGYFLIGCAYLTKQNFLVVPLAVWVLFHIKDWRALLAWLLPGLLYLLWLIAGNAFADFLNQMQSETSLLQVGVIRFLTSPFFLLGLLGMLVLYIIHRKYQRLSTKVVHGLSLLVLFGLTAAMALGKYELRPPSFVFGLLTGTFLMALWRYREWTLEGKALALVIIIAWATSISVGMNTPVFLIGPMLLALWPGMFLVLGYPIPQPRQLPKWMKVSLGTVAVLTLGAYHYAHLNYIYRDLPVTGLGPKLGEVLPGGEGIYTNAHLHQMLEELQTLIDTTRQPYAMLPDYTAWWAASQQLNPLPLDWVAGLEAESPIVQQRVQEALREVKARGGYIYVSRYQLRDIATTATPLEETPERYEVVQWLRNKYPLKRGTRYWEVY